MDTWLAIWSGRAGYGGSLTDPRGVVYRTMVLFSYLNIWFGVVDLACMDSMKFGTIVHLPWIHQSRGSLVCLFKQVGSAVRTWLYKHLGSVLVALGRGAGSLRGFARKCARYVDLLANVLVTRKRAACSLRRGYVDLLANMLVALRRGAAWIYSRTCSLLANARRAIRRGAACVDFICSFMAF